MWLKLMLHDSLGFKFIFFYLRQPEGSGQISISILQSNSTAKKYRKKYC